MNSGWLGLKPDLSRETHRRPGLQALPPRPRPWPGHTSSEACTSNSDPRGCCPAWAPLIPTLHVHVQLFHTPLSQLTFSLQLLGPYPLRLLLSECLS